MPPDLVIARNPLRLARIMSPTVPTVWQASVSIIGRPSKKPFGACLKPSFGGVQMTLFPSVNVCICGMTSGLTSHTILPDPPLSSLDNIFVTFSALMVAAVCDVSFAWDTVAAAAMIPSGMPAPLPLTNESCTFQSTAPPFRAGFPNS